MKSSQQFAETSQHVLLPSRGAVRFIGDLLTRTAIFEALFKLWLADDRLQ
jgi:hypothetical protein